MPPPPANSSPRKSPPTAMPRSWRGYSSGWDASPPSASTRSTPRPPRSTSCGGRSTCSREGSGSPWEAPGSISRAAGTDRTARPASRNTLRAAIRIGSRPSARRRPPHEPEGPVDRLGDSDSRGGEHGQRLVVRSGEDLYRCGRHGQPVQRAGYAQRLAEFSGTVGEVARVHRSPPPADRLHSLAWDDPPEQHRAPGRRAVADQVGTPVNPVGAVNVPGARRSVETPVPRVQPSFVGVGSGIVVAQVRLGLDDDSPGAAPSGGRYDRRPEQVSGNDRGGATEKRDRERLHSVFFTLGFGVRFFAAAPSLGSFTGRARGARAGLATASTTGTWTGTSSSTRTTPTRGSSSGRIGAREPRRNRSAAGPRGAGSAAGVLSGADPLPVG